MHLSVLPIPVIVAAEDVLLAAIAERLLAEFGDKYRVTKSRVTGGCSQLDKDVKKWNQSATSGNVHLVLRDLDSLANPQDSGNCPESKICELLGGVKKHPRFIFRIAVAESENWLLADFDNLRKFLEISTQRLQSPPDEIKDGKEMLINLARRSRRRDVRNELPPQGRTAPVGRMWNSMLSDFIYDKWNPRAAAQKSKSLRRTLARFDAFSP